MLRIKVWRGRSVRDWTKEKRGAEAPLSLNRKTAVADQYVPALYGRSSGMYVAAEPLMACW